MAAGFFCTQFVSLNCILAASFCINQETLTGRVVLVDRKHPEVRFL